MCLLLNVTGEADESGLWRQYNGQQDRSPLKLVYVVGGSVAKMAPAEAGYCKGLPL